jgi:Fe2+ transport system protein FeoA
MTLSELRPGIKAQLEGLRGPSELVERLREMGLHKGVELSLLQRSPFAGPMIFVVSNTVIALRAAEAECVLIQITA